MARIPHIHGHLRTGFTFSTSMWWRETKARSSPGISQAPVPHTWSVLPPLFPRVDMRGLQRLLLGSGNGPFYPHGESESWGQSRVGNQSTFLQEERVRGRPGARGTGGGLGACLPSISAPVDEIWLSTRLTVPISLQNLFLGLERSAYCWLSP